MSPACSHVTKQGFDPYSQISIDNIIKNCRPTERWNGGLLGVPVDVVRFDKCLDIDVLLAITINTEVTTDVIRRTSMKLMSLHYAEYLNNNHDPAEGGNMKKLWSIKKLKEETKDVWYTQFFRLIHKNVQCTKEKCKEIK